MSTQVTLTSDARSAQANALIPLLNSGFIKIYSGAIPASVSAPRGAAVLLATCPLNVASAPVTTTGTLTFDMTGVEDDSIDADGTATFYRTYEADGLTPVTQGSVGLDGSGESMTMASIDLVENGTLIISSFTHTV
tara:strand:+ start:23 stop:430 length:408 start_codon:yes stop_codon:yes gene_type:complete